MEIATNFNAEGSDLRKHQLIMLEMLIYFDGICRENNIQYWLSSGNLLGAVRHGGFIPWDDDVDVEMLRSDYLRLEKIWSCDLKYDFQSRKTDFFYTAPYAKLRDRRSKVEEYEQDVNYKYKGIYLDIFSLEYTNRFSANIFAPLTWRVLNFGSNVKTSFGSKVFGLMKKILYLSISITRFISKFCPWKKLRLTYGSGFTDNIRYEDRIFPLTTIKFEGVEFPAPKDVNFYLTSLYGDYMKLPDISELTPHLTKIEFESDNNRDITTIV